MSKRIPARDRMKIQRTRMPEQDALERGHNFLEVNLGLPAECARSGIDALHRVQGPEVHLHLPGGGQGEGVPRSDSGGRLPRRRRQGARRQRAAGHHRARLPAGRPVRGRLPAGQQGRAARPSATWSASSPTTSRPPANWACRPSRRPPARKSPSWAAARPA